MHQYFISYSKAEAPVQSYNRYRRKIHKADADAERNLPLELVMTKNEAYAVHNFDQQQEEHVYIWCDNRRLAFTIQYISDKHFISQKY